MTSLSTTLNNALTGLSASSRQANVIADNVANALTPGYSRRELEVAPLVLAGQGQGVSVIGVNRVNDPITTAARRISQAETAAAQTTSDAQAQLLQTIGEPTDPTGLSARADALITSLTAASDTPESNTQLAETVLRAREFSNKINEISDKIGDLRVETDAAIAQEVNLINRTLVDIERLNGEIQIATLRGDDVAALQDQRGQLIDRLADAVPLRVIQRENNQVALFAQNGATLLEGVAYELEFTASPIIIAQSDTIANGALSGISIDGIDIPIGTGGVTAFLDGGSLAAKFELRDETLPGLYTQIDALARDLVERVQGLPEDGTLGAGDPGLFTDGGFFFDPANEEGLAGRLRLNANVDPIQGGDVTRLRDGLNAAALGEVGDATILRGLQDALSTPIAASAASGLFGQRDFAGFATEFSSQVFQSSALADDRLSVQTGRFETLSDAENNISGVDTDQELARLLVVEQAFQANVRVIQTVDELLQELLAI